jgi:hypothetical protein
MLCSLASRLELDVISIAARYAIFIIVQVNRCRSDNLGIFKSPMPDYRGLSLELDVFASLELQDPNLEGRAREGDTATNAEKRNRVIHSRGRATAGELIETSLRHVE